VINALYHPFLPCLSGCSYVTLISGHIKFHRPLQCQLMAELMTST